MRLQVQKLQTELEHSNDETNCRVSCQCESTCTAPTSGKFKTLCWPSWSTLVSRKISGYIACVQQSLCISSCMQVQRITMSVACKKSVAAYVPPFFPSVWVDTVCCSSGRSFQLICCHCAVNMGCSLLLLLQLNAEMKTGKKGRRTKNNAHCCSCCSSLLVFQTLN